MVKRGTPKKRGRGRTPIGVANPIDVHVGSRIKLRRTLLGMSQTKLAEAIGLTFQQVQKYEKGSNRVGSSRLFELARVLDVRISYFFEEMDGETAERGHKHTMGTVTKAPPKESDPMTNRETLELARIYYKVSNPKVRKRLLEMLRALVSSLEGMK